MKSIRYLKRLIEFDSTSSKSNRLISRYLEMKLTKHGFVVEKLEYRDKRNVRKVNLIAKKGTGTGGLAWFGHSDVVPAKDWFTNQFGPFEATIVRERIYGRGSCDMKGSIASMLEAVQQFSWDELRQPIYMVITADEEVGFHGARIVTEESKQYREIIEGGTRGIIGEPTGLDVVYAHKGSVRIVAKSFGESAHSSTTAGRNSNLNMIPFLNEMKSIHDETESQPKWQHSQFDPPTISWNIIVKDNSPALNVKPSLTTCVVYARTMPGVDIQPLLDRAQACADANGLRISITHFAEPFYTDPDSEFVTRSLLMANRASPKTVSFGTDGGIFSEMENRIVFGPGSIQQAHTHDEWIAIEQLKLATEIYEKMIRHWCCDTA